MQNFDHSTTLKLLAALILARLTARNSVLLSAVSNAGQNNVLYWIKGKDKEWKQFVNHRVAEIRQLLPLCEQNSKPVGPVGSGSFTSEVLFSESLWILESQKSLLQNRNFKRQCAQLGIIRVMNGTLRCKGKLCSSPLP